MLFQPTNFTNAIYTALLLLIIPNKGFCFYNLYTLSYLNCMIKQSIVLIDDDNNPFDTGISVMPEDRVYVCTTSNNRSVYTTIFLIRESNETGTPITGRPKKSHIRRFVFKKESFVEDTETDINHILFSESKKNTCKPRLPRHFKGNDRIIELLASYQKKTRYYKIKLFYRIRQKNYSAVYFITDSLQIPGSFFSYPFPVADTPEGSLTQSMQPIK